MKRNLSLIRELFFIIENFPVQIDKNYKYKISIKSYSKEEIDFHINLMKEANFVDGIIHRSIINKHITIYYETLEIKWEGYDFLNSIRDNKVWGAFKKKFGNGELPLSIIKEICKGFILQFITVQLK